MQRIEPCSAPAADQKYTGHSGKDSGPLNGETGSECSRSSKSGRRCFSGTIEEACHRVKKRGTPSLAAMTGIILEVRSHSGKDSVVGAGIILGASVAIMHRTQVHFDPRVERRQRARGKGMNVLLRRHTTFGFQGKNRQQSALGFVFSHGACRFTEEVSILVSLAADDSLPATAAFARPYRANK